MSSGNRVSASLALLLISLMISVPLSGCTGNLVDDEYEISSKDNEEFDDVQINEGIDNTFEESLDKIDNDIGKELGADEREIEIGIPDLENPIHGWDELDNIGEALLRNRKAFYIPIQEWDERTGESLVNGWNVLAHSYPIPSD